MMKKLAVAALVVAVLAPAITLGEVVRLRDGSSINGRLVGVDGDSLTFRLAAGPRVRLHRSQVIAIVFDDAAGGGITGEAPAGGAGAGAPVRDTGTGRVMVAFKDRRVSSKISVDKRKDWDEHVRSNHIVLELLVDGRTVHTVADTTTDKKIYKGHITQLKNDALLEDFTVEVPAGIHQCEVIVRSRDPDTFREHFDPEPLYAVLVLDGFEVRAGATARIDVGIERGKFKLGRVKFYRVE